MYLYAKFVCITVYPMMAETRHSIDTFGRTDHNVWNTVVCKYISYIYIVSF